MPCVLVENKRPRQRWLGALAAIFPLAQPAVDADRRALGTGDVVARRIDELGGMANLAAEPDGETRLHMRPRHGGAAQRLCDREIAAAVGQFDDLLQQAVRRVEGGMHVPERAGAAEFREWKRAGGEPLRDVARIVHPQQEERYTARVRPLQRGEAVADLLEAGVEATRQNVLVVAERLSRAQERLIGR